MLDEKQYGAPDEARHHGHGQSHGAQIEIQYFTDPLCCWSWAFEPQWRRLRYEFAGQLKWRYHMGGLIPDWTRFSDPLNDVSRPLQMGPLWFEARHLSGMPIDDKLWFSDPPKSSYPACIAVKCAQQQSPEATEAYLRSLRKAVMTEGRNIARKQVLVDIAAELAIREPALLDAGAFERALSGEPARKAFEQDLQMVRAYNISRFPALTLKRPGASGVMIVGYRPYDALLVALEQAAPGIKPTRRAEDRQAYQSFWPDANDRELAEATPAAPHRQ